ncbi:hypothetical protein [Poseidonibacter lekithochrous]|uniref:hypothetical protein n=1 Tax=Poseidonibacter lekithochrous TaxID=1904463 RepID=UPI000D39CB9B|nr:hypothetical protein [Poseidonibacter lekithochrous]
MTPISQDFAPPFKLIAPYFIIGSIFYFLSTLYSFNLDISEISIHSTNLLSLAHLFLLGFAMMVIFGAMAQLIPVTLEVGHFSVEFYYLIYPFLVIGTILMVLGFSVNNTFLQYGGILVFISMIIFLAETFLTINKVKQYSNVIKSIVVSNIFLTLGIIFGIIMALTYAGQINTNIEEILKAHVYSVILGYITITIMALSLVLIPMFGLSHNFSQKPLNNAVILMSISTTLVIISSIFSIAIIDKLAYLLSVVSLAIYFYQVYLIFKTRARKENDIYVLSLFVAFIAFVLSIITGFLWIFIGNERLLITTAWLMFCGFFTFVIIGHLYKIIPFLVWFEKFSPLVGKQKVPMLMDMVPKKASYYQFAFTLLGTIVSTFGLILAENSLFKAGISFLAIGAIFLINNIIYIIRYK